MLIKLRMSGKLLLSVERTAVKINRPNYQGGNMCMYHSLDDKEKEVMRAFLHKTWDLERHFQTDNEVSNQERVVHMKRVALMFTQLKDLSNAREVGDDSCCQWYDLAAVYEKEDSAFAGHSGFGDKGFGKNYAKMVVKS